MSVQRARIETKSCPMFDETCAKKVAEHVAAFMVQPFSVEQAMAMIVTACGRYRRGGHVGALKGYAHMKVCTVGGWYTSGPGQRNGFVARPGKLYGLTIADFNGNVLLAVGITNL